MTDNVKPESIREQLSLVINKAGWGVDHSDDQSDEIADAILSAFSVALPREDADLDAIEASMDLRREDFADDDGGRVEFSLACERFVQEHGPALLARVRTAEAAIDRVQEYAKDRYLYGKRMQSTVHSARIASDLFEIVGGRPE